MTRDEVIALAEQAGIDCDTDGDIWGSTNGSLLKFAAMVADKEREVSAEVSSAVRIDANYAGRLALMLECAILNPSGFFDEACALLDAYKAEWEKINPPVPTFMGEPMPPERRAIFAEMKAKREGKK